MRIGVAASETQGHFGRLQVRSWFQHRESGFSDCSFPSRVSDLEHTQPFWCDLCSDLLFVKGGVCILTCKISLPSESALIIYYLKKTLLTSELNVLFQDLD